MSATQAPLGPRQLDFTQLSDEDFELLAYLVILLDHGDAIRLRAPERGADAALPASDGTYERCWQAKRFTSTVYWSQCKDSLDAAAECYAMPRYTFCFARDLTGKQQQLFTKHLVGRQKGVDVDWWGASRLTGYLLASEQGQRIQTHFYGDPEVDTRALMTAFRAGGELSTGADAIARLSAIADYLESHDPFFTYVATTRSVSAVPTAASTPGTVMAVEMTELDRAIRIEALPRNQAAWERLPGGQLQFSNTPEGRAERDTFLRTLRLGGEATFRQAELRFEVLPAVFQEIVPSSGPMEVTIRANVPTPEPWDARLRVESDRGTALMDIDLRPADPTDGWDQALSGSSGGLSMTLLLRARQGRGEARATWRYQPLRERLSEQAAALAVLDAMHGTGTLFVEDRDGGPRAIEHSLESRSVDDVLVWRKQVIDDLLTIEQWLEETIHLPGQWTRGDLEVIAQTAQLIRVGERSITVGELGFSMLPESEVNNLGEPPMKIWMASSLSVLLFGVEREIGYMSGEVSVKMTRCDPEPGNDGFYAVTLAPIDDASAKQTFRLTRDRPEPGTTSA